ncbi:unnamed protein product [marine sediment metagenome]|uniref:Uncharacterized protein n=1 Tax=marine sediment metagenome TaxID=412755 RepID=X0YX47_9ZZZZ
MGSERTADKIEHKFERTGDEWKKEATKEYREDVKFVADLMTIKVNNLRPWYETGRLVVASATLETIYSRRIQVGELLVMTHASAQNSLNQTTTTEICIERGGEIVSLRRDVPSAADISIDWDGQVILIEGDRAMARFRGSTAANIATASFSGYKIKA